MPHARRLYLGLLREGWVAEPGAVLPLPCESATVCHSDGYGKCPRQFDAAAWD